MQTGYSQTFTATRIDGRPTGHTFDSGGFDPIIDLNNFQSVGVSDASELGNINGPSLIRVPDWLAPEERVDPSANFYMYFANHSGDSIRMAWASSLTGDWNLFNYGSAPDSAWGVGGSHTGPQTPGNGVLDLDIGDNDRMSFDGGAGFEVFNHIASPDVFVDDVNQQIAMYFHGPNAGTGPSGQQTFVTTSSDGLNFNTFADGGQTGHGPRDVIPSEFYARAFTVSGQTFAFTNKGDLWQAPLTNANAELNTIANADTEGGLWNPIGSNNLNNQYWNQIGNSSNPIKSFYVENGQGADDVRHVAIHQRDHIDPNDTNIYYFYSARYDTPESIFLSVMDTNDGSTDPADWSVIGQRLILQPELDWEGADQPLEASKNGSQTNVRQLRDPAIFEDTMGTADPSDDKVYLFYSGEGEEAIGIAELTFDPFTSNTAFPQGDLFPLPPDSPSAMIDFNGVTGPTQEGYVAGAAQIDPVGNGLHTVTVPLTDPFGSGDIVVALEADRWKTRPLIDDTNPANEFENLIIDFGGPREGSVASLTFELPEGEYLIELVQHESSRSASETASLSILDANGFVSGVELISSFGTDPSEIKSSDFVVTSNGVDEVVFLIDNTDNETLGAYPINGLTIEAVLDPDFNGDGSVDGLDFLAWQRGESRIPFSNSDLLLWEEYYQSGSSLSDDAKAVPETNVLLLSLFGLLILSAKRRRQNLSSSTCLYFAYPLLIYSPTLYEQLEIAFPIIKA